MENTFSIISLTKNDSDYLDQLELIFYDYYKSMENKGLLIKIVDDGGKLWRKSIENGLGKTQIIVIALVDDKIAGFIWGYITISPSYIGSSLVGVWNGIYVVPKYWQLGLSDHMYQEMKKWFTIKMVHSIEAKSLIGNSLSIKFIKKLGFREELVQFRNSFTMDIIV
jgi:RimJ/RimL family protein N-acetyltransferase